ncbi:methyltransferase domain-containing protein [Micromonospora sp. NPDC047707]|uniref:class I SAM-dependent methyltransferase n=1 Tax=Micromonospora sp. NPDC047707 TaxID=3154498 RepID=UPI0034536E2F
MATITHHQLHPVRLGELLDPVIRRELDRIEILPGHHVLDIGAGTGQITTHLARLVGPHGTVSAVDADTRHLDPTGIIDVYQRHLDGDVLPGAADTQDIIVARWLRPLPHPAEVLEQMVARLRPGGWLVLADILDTPPRLIQPTNPDDARLIHTVLRRIYRTIADPHSSGTWSTDPETLLHHAGMAQVCVHTSTETWTGGGPGCRILADTTDHLRPLLTGPDLTDTDLDRFSSLITDPSSVLGSYHRRAVHARTAS